MILNEVNLLERMLADKRHRIVITPILNMREQIQPTSVDLRLGTEFKIIRNVRFPYLNLLEEKEKAERNAYQYTDTVKITYDEKFALHPNEFALGSTLEYIRLPSDIAGRMEGKSTWGRVGLQIHSTAGYVDPGFAGSLTFELQNVGKVPIPLYPGLRVAQITFYSTEFDSTIPYGKKAYSLYGGNVGTVGSRYYELPEIEVLRRIQEEKKDQ